MGEGSVILDGATVYYSGSTDRRVAGVGFVVDRLVNSSVMVFKPIDERICYLRISGGSHNLSLVCVYAPTEDADMRTKDEFYTKLNHICEGLPLYDAKIVLGDLNAKVGREVYHRPTIGRHSLHQICNDNGERLVSLAASNGMVIASTTFQHKNIHKYTWLSADGFTKNQIDHLLIDQRHRSGVTDVRGMRGADCDSDHCLVKAVYTFRTRASRSHFVGGNTTTRWNLEALRDGEVCERYQSSLAELLPAREPCSQVPVNNDIESRWVEIIGAIKNAAETCIGKLGRVGKNDWFDETCRLAVEERKKKRMAFLLRGTRSRRRDFIMASQQTRRILRSAKRRFFCQRVVELNMLGRNPKLFYKHLKGIAGSGMVRSPAIYDESGVLLSEGADIIGRWVRFFDNLYNCQTTNVRHQPQFGVDNDTIVEDPSLEELEECLGGLRGDKSAGEDDVPVDLIKYGGHDLIRRMYDLILSIWQNEVMPSGWNVAVICPIHKKGNTQYCENYRGISLLSGAYKLFGKILLGRLAPLVEAQIGDYQCGFRPGRSTVDQIFSVKQIIEKSWEYGINLHHIFVDFRQAYDSVDRGQLWQAMSDLGLPRKLINLTRMCVSGSVSKVRFQGALSQPFTVTTGVRQGDALSPLLFNIALESIMRSIHRAGQAGPWADAVMLAYADDIDIIGRSGQEVEDVLGSLAGAACDLGLGVNWDKTKYMVVSRTGRENTSVSVGAGSLEWVKSFKYLGATLTEDNSESTEISARILSANRSYFSLAKVLGNRLLSRRNKLRIYKTIIRPVVVYACETWAMTVRDMHRLDRFERKVLRRIFGPRRDGAGPGFRNLRSNEEVMAMYADVPLSGYVRTQRLRWAGHVARMGTNRLARATLDSGPGGTRPVGRPRLRWGDRVAEDASLLGSENWWEDAQNRQGWREILSVAEAHHWARGHL